jgi:hypothetical protein
MGKLDKQVGYQQALAILHEANDCARIDGENVQQLGCGVAGFLGLLGGRHGDQLI